ncbi:RDD family protein [Massilia sp. W12]|uniref:RDD family protein n=1 Tax=Massilia sp. W12 TaxID=3126507 RepID=UPI0030D22669
MSHIHNTRAPTVYDGRISQTTPEGVRLLLTPAGPFPRMQAWLIDQIIIQVSLFLLKGIFFSGKEAGIGLFMLSEFVVLWFYPALFEQFNHGQTPGKRLMHLRVVRANGMPIDWRGSITRAIMMVADFMPGMFFSGLMCMMSDPKFRRLGDLAAQSLVIHVEKEPQRKKTDTDVTPCAPPYPLSPAQQRVLIDLFERENSISHERMLELASLAQGLTGASGEASLQKLRAIVAGLRQ